MARALYKGRTEETLEAEAEAEAEAREGIFAATRKGSRRRVGPEQVKNVAVTAYQAGRAGTAVASVRWASASTGWTARVEWKAWMELTSAVNDLE
ncbi:hypothetical protein GUJ93_ZPchr0002g26256 [Zizania palustris]|uniref:Uncharacterized protein n=1 Tax=Zizania palustris TaxID=103762 RepID=A0A8J5RVG7_ZIZPA|nr:hypothetical protein GUJ93_ZPchr0002g26256 [Zizania palustris]